MNTSKRMRRLATADQVKSLRIPAHEEGRHFETCSPVRRITHQEQIPYLRDVGSEPCLSGTRISGFEMGADSYGGRDIRNAPFVPWEVISRSTANLSCRLFALRHRRFRGRTFLSPRRSIEGPRVTSYRQATVSRRPDRAVKARTPQEPLETSFELGEALQPLQRRYRSL